MVIVRDITQVARLEEDLRQARERFIEQEALRTMGEIAAGVGHDLVNILTAFKLRTGQLAKHARARGVELRHVDVVLRAAQQAANLAAVAIFWPSSGHLPRPAGVLKANTIRSARSTLDAFSYGGMQARPAFPRRRDGTSLADVAAGGVLERWSIDDVARD